MKLQYYILKKDISLSFFLFLFTLSISSGIGKKLNEVIANEVMSEAQGNDGQDCLTKLSNFQQSSVTAPLDLPSNIGSKIEINLELFEKKGVV